MCLVIDRNKHKELKCKIAKEDIPCYKFLILDEGNHKFVTPFRNTEITFGEDSLVSNKFEEVPIVKKFLSSDPSNNRKRETDYIIQYGINYGIHAFTNLNYATGKLLEFGSIRYKGEIIKPCLIKCFVEKGVKFWLGKDYQICAEKLRLDNEFKYYENPKPTFKQLIRD